MIYTEEQLREMPLTELYSLTYGELLCPFPRLSAMRCVLISEAFSFDLEELAKEQAKETEYVLQRALINKVWAERKEEG